MVTFVAFLMLVLVASAVVAKVSGTLALIVTAAWLIGIEHAHQYVAPLWWTFGVSVVISVVGLLITAYIAER